MINKEQALQLRRGMILYHGLNRNADGTPQRWKVNGECKTWKTIPKDYKLSIKHGIRYYSYLGVSNGIKNAHEFFLQEYEAYLYGSKHGVPITGMEK